MKRLPFRVVVPDRWWCLGVDVPEEGLVASSDSVSEVLAWRCLDVFLVCFVWCVFLLLEDDLFPSSCTSQSTSDSEDESDEFDSESESEESYSESDSLSALSCPRRSRISSSMRVISKGSLVAAVPEL